MLGISPHALTDMCDLVTLSSMKTPRKGKYFLILRWRESGDRRGEIRNTPLKWLKSLHPFVITMLNWVSSHITWGLKGTHLTGHSPKAAKVFQRFKVHLGGSQWVNFPRLRLFRGISWSQMPCLPTLFSRKTLVFHLNWYVANILSQRHWGALGTGMLPTSQMFVNLSSEMWHNTTNCQVV